MFGSRFGASLSATPSSPSDPEGPSGENGAARGPRPANPDYESGQSERHGIQFDRIVNAVDDLGWDPSGGATVDVPKDDGLLIEIPNGTYQIGRNVFYGTANWGMVGIGDDVTFVPPVGRCVRAVQVSSNDPGTNILLENIEWHQRDGMEAGIQLSPNVSDGLEIHHCSRTGRTPNDRTAGPPYSQDPSGIKCAVLDADGEGTIAHWTDHCETTVIDYPGNASGLFFGFSCRGRVRIEDSSVKNMGEHAIYGSKAHQVEVVHCDFRNNANTNLRIAGEGSFAKDSIFGFERDASYTEHHGPKPGKKATKILRAENEKTGESGGYFENCHFFSKSPGLEVSYLMLFMGSVGGMEVRDCLIRNEVDDDGAVVQPIGSGWRGKVPPGPDWIKFIGCRFEGASNQPPIVSNRPGEVHALDCVCDMPNAPRAQGLATHDIDYIS